MSRLFTNVDPFSTPIRATPFRATPPDTKSSIMTKSQVIELIDSIEFTYVPVPSDYVNSDQAIDLEKFLKEMCLSLSGILLKNSPPKTSPKKLLNRIGSSSRDDDTPTKIVPRRNDLESYVHLDTDISDAPPTLVQRLRKLRSVQPISDGNTSSKEMLRSSDQVGIPSPQHDRFLTRAGPSAIEASDIISLENAGGSAIEDIPVNVVTKMGQEIARIMSSHRTGSSTLNHNSLLTITARVIAADPGLRVLDYAPVDDIPERVLSKVRSEIAQIVETAKPPYVLTAIQKTGTKLPFVEIRGMVKSLTESTGPFEGVTNFVVNALWDSAAEVSMIAAESLSVEMSVGQKQGVVYAFKYLSPTTVLTIALRFPGINYVVSGPAWIVPRSYFPGGGLDIDIILGQNVRILF
jgi:hypothetical protein